MEDPGFENLMPEQKLNAIRHYEQEIDRLLAEKKITEWESWECYFELMYNCNLLEFMEDRKRIVSKIDREKFNPLLSKKPEIILIARDILARHGFNIGLDN